jgi:hypothetical protein
MRTILLGAGLALALVLAACGGGSDSKQPTSLAVPPGSVTGTAASPSVTSSTLSGADAPPTQLNEVEPVLTKRVYAPGEALPEMGTGFMDPKTGSMEVWSPKVALAADDYGSISTNGDWLSYATSQGRQMYLLDRTNGKTFVLPELLSAQGFPDVASGPKMIGIWTIPGGGEVVVIDSATGAVARTGLTYSNHSSWSLVYSPDDTRLAVINGNEIAFLDISTAALTDIAALPTDGAIYSLAPAPNEAGFLLERQEDGQHPGTPVKAYDWDGHELANNPTAAKPSSPDGRLYAESESLATFGASGLVYPTLSVTTVRRIGSEEPVMRVLGGSAPVWTADSGGIIVSVKDGEYRLVDLDGTVVMSLPAERGIPGLVQPKPSPSNVGLIGTVEGILKVPSGELLKAAISEDNWRVITEWLHGGAEYAMSWGPTGGKDWGIPQELFAPKTELPPFGDSSVLAVNTAGDCLNLREKPSTSAASLGCYPDGALGTITSAPDPLYDPIYDKEEKGPQPFGGVRLPEDGSVWLHLRMGDGKAGWMSAEFLGWGS